jgi:Na+-driven multidrug efflux pump
MGVLMQSLSGAGDTVPTAVVGVLTVWLVTLPLAYFLPKITDLGMYGVRWGMASGMIFSALTYTIYFRTGRWKRKQV